MCWPNHLLQRKKYHPQTVKTASLFHSAAHHCLFWCLSLSLSNSSHLLSCFHGSPLIFQPSNQQPRPHIYMTWITNQEPNSFDSSDFSRSSVKREVDKSSEIISTYINSNSHGCNNKELVTSLGFSSNIAHFPLSHAYPAKAYIFQLPLPWAVTTWMTFGQLKESDGCYSSS